LLYGCLAQYEGIKSASDVLLDACVRDKMPNVAQHNQSSHNWTTWRYGSGFSRITQASISCPESDTTWPQGPHHHLKCSFTWQINQLVGREISLSLSHSLSLSLSQTRRKSPPEVPPVGCLQVCADHNQVALALSVIDTHKALNQQLANCKLPAESLPSQLPAGVKIPPPGAKSLLNHP
jgi:hypothetical protein